MAAMLAQAARHRGPHRGALPVLPAQARAGLGRREPARVPGPLDRRSARRRGRHLGRGGGAGQVAVPLLEGDLRLRRAQPALARDHPRRAARGDRLARAGALRRGLGLQRDLADAQARRREVGHRARLREPQVRRGPGARRGAAAECRRARRPLPGRCRELRVHPRALAPWRASSGAESRRRSVRLRLRGPAAAGRRGPGAPAPAASPVRSTTVVGCIGQAPASTTACTSFWKRSRISCGSFIGSVSPGAISVVAMQRLARAARAAPASPRGRARAGRWCAATGATAGAAPPSWPPG